MEVDPDYSEHVEFFRNPRVSEKDKLVRILENIETTLKLQNADKRFTYLPYKYLEEGEPQVLGTGKSTEYPLLIDFDSSAEEAERALVVRREQGIKLEVIAVVPIEQEHEDEGDFLLRTDDEVFTGRRPLKVARKKESGDIYYKTVTPAEGAGQIVFHPMGYVDQEDFSQTRNGNSIKFTDVLQRSVGREIGEEVGAGLLQISSSHFILQPYLDNQTNVIVYPIAILMNEENTRIFLAHMMNSLGRESDIDSERYGFTRLASLSFDALTRPNDYYPGTLQILHDLVSVVIKKGEESK